MKYGYKTIIRPKMKKLVPRFSVHDDAGKTLAHCFNEEHAARIVYALNFAAGEPVVWSCGHAAGAHCSTCWQQLAGRAHELAMESLGEAGGREP